MEQEIIIYHPNHVWYGEFQENASVQSGILIHNHMKYKHPRIHSCLLERRLMYDVNSKS